MNIEVDREHRTITVDQSGYLSRIIDKFGMSHSNPCANPLEARPHKKTSEESPADIGEYRQAIGSLLYAALGSRPDIAYAVGVLGRYAANPSQAHFKSVKHLIRYIKGTIGRKLTIYRPGLGDARNQIVAYADSDLAGDIDDSKSTSGYVIYIDGILTAWKSKKQSITAQSTMHAELIATASAKRTVDWLTDFVNETSLDRPNHLETPVIFNDNQACVTVLGTGNFKGDNRHLRLRYYGIYEAIAKGTLRIEHMAGADMVADGLTKPLVGTAHENFVRMIGMV
jgi:hypothetical protein